MCDSARICSSFENNYSQTLVVPSVMKIRYTGNSAVRGLADGKTPGVVPIEKRLYIARVPAKSAGNDDKHRGNPLLVERRTQRGGRSNGRGKARAIMERGADIAKLSINPIHRCRSATAKNLCLAAPLEGNPPSPGAFIIVVLFLFFLFSSFSFYFCFVRGLILYRRGAQ